MAEFDIKVGTEVWTVKGSFYQWSVGPMRTRKDGTPYHDVHSFYSSMEGMMKGVLERSIRLADATSIQELQVALKQKKDELSGLYDLHVGKNN